MHRPETVAIEIEWDDDSHNVSHRTKLAYDQVIVSI